MLNGSVIRAVRPDEKLGGSLTSDISDGFQNVFIDKKINRMFFKVLLLRVPVIF